MVITFYLYLAAFKSHGTTILSGGWMKKDVLGKGALAIVANIFNFYKTYP